MLTEAGAIAAVETLLGKSGYAGLRAVRRSDFLWSVVPVDGDGWSVPGGGWLVGNDSKLWALSSNPAIHDWDLAVSLLDRLYRDGLTVYVEPEAFIERLRKMTEHRLALEADVIRDARAGALRGRSSRVLP